MAEYARGIEGIKVLDMIDLMSLNMSRRAEHGSAFIARILRWESKLLKRYEAQMDKEYDRLVMVSADDAHLAQSSELIQNKYSYLKIAEDYLEQLS
jgi:hypothetical protein